MSDLPPPSAPVPPEPPPHQPGDNAAPPEVPEASSVPPPPAPPPEIPDVISSEGHLQPRDSTESSLGIVMHLLPFLGFLAPWPGINLLAPALLWLFKRGDSPYLDAHGKAVVNFQITLTIALFVAMLTLFICVGVILVPAVAIGGAILSILGAIKASERKLYKYPFSLDLVK